MKAGQVGKKNRTRKKDIWDAARALHGCPEANLVTLKKLNLFDAWCSACGSLRHSETEIWFMSERGSCKHEAVQQ